ncbi:MAG TPA: hypothetical protein VMT57_10065 [Candidatus Thermoplasmatota archaeon]|nr:hypothetical protein [Candidatus Thermoplasmatota archaeon]
MNSKTFHDVTASLLLIEPSHNFRALLFASVKTLDFIVTQWGADRRNIAVLIDLAGTTQVSFFGDVFFDG